MHWSICAICNQIASEMTPFKWLMLGLFHEIFYAPLSIVSNNNFSWLYLFQLILMFLLCNIDFGQIMVQIIILLYRKWVCHSLLLDRQMDLFFSKIKGLRKFWNNTALFLIFGEFFSFSRALWKLFKLAYVYYFFKFWGNFLNSLVKILMEHFQM